MKSTLLGPTGWTNKIRSYYRTAIPLYIPAAWHLCVPKILAIVNTVSDLSREGKLMRYSRHLAFWSHALQTFICDIKSLAHTQIRS